MKLKLSCNVCNQMEWLLVTDNKKTYLECGACGTKKEIEFVKPKEISITYRQEFLLSHPHCGIMARGMV